MQLSCNGVAGRALRFGPAGPWARAGESCFQAPGRTVWQRRNASVKRSRLMGLSRYFAAPGAAAVPLSPTMLTTITGRNECDWFATESHVLAARFSPAGRGHEPVKVAFRPPEERFGSVATPPSNDPG